MRINFLQQYKNNGKTNVPKNTLGSISGRVVFWMLVYLVLVIKLATIQEFTNDWFFVAYSVTVSAYILSRFGIAYFYEPERAHVFDPLFEPTLSFAVPSLNEGEHIRETIMRIAQSSYPKNKFDIIAVNDGSTDNTYDEMMEARAEAKKIGVTVTVINWLDNRGKREGMAECIRQSKNDLMVFIDSDSFVEPTTARELAKYFFAPNVAAVAGHAFVANENKNFLTKMQAVRYYIAFKVYKSVESLFGSVTCCSGCCSAYRRTHLLEVMDEWLNQTMFGVKRTYGDDRSLTNCLLERGYDCLFSPTAIAYTFAPETFRQFMKQQLRWKKSWIVESIKAMRFIWKRNPIMSISFYTSVMLTLLAPIIMVRSLVWYPITTNNGPWFYLFGLTLMAFVYGVYYYNHTNDKKWFYGVLFSSFYSLVLVWQLPYAALKLRDSRWGTRTGIQQQKKALDQQQVSPVPNLVVPRMSGKGISHI